MVAAWVAILSLSCVFALNFTSNSAETYFNFLLSNPSPLQNGYFAYSPATGVTIVLREMAKRTDCIVKVPIRYVITSVDEYPLSEYLEGFEQFERMTIRLLYERYADQRWNDYPQRYIKALPSDFMQPLLWSEKDFELLRRFSAEERTVEEVKRFDLNAFLHHLNFAFKSVPEVPKQMLTREALAWGLLTAASRSIPSSKELMAALGSQRLDEDSYVFIPGMDVINHFPFKPSKKKQNFSYFASSLHETDPWVCYRALRLQLAGAQFAGYYGDKTSFDLLTSYGFALEFNPEDEIDLKFAVDDYCLGTKEGDFCDYKVKMGAIDMRVLKSMLGSIAGIMFKDTYSLVDIEKYILSLKNSFAKKKAAMGVFLNYRNNFVYRSTQTAMRMLRRERQMCTDEKCRLILTYCIGQRAGRYVHVQKMERELLKLYSAEIIS